MHVPFKIHYRNNLIDKTYSYLISCPPSWDDRNYSYGHQLYPSDYTRSCIKNKKICLCEKISFQVFFKYEDFVILFTNCRRTFTLQCHEYNTKYKVILIMLKNVLIRKCSFFSILLFNFISLYFFEKIHHKLYYLLNQRLLEIK